ncbi:MAG: permease-like cell division protein FtsX [Melioribacteraceae bacterium]|jgi:cell division transport system permease protein|nr:permease-like cell division protein FtsX [Melioribacteraceae bacterium]
MILFYLKETFRLFSRSFWATFVLISITALAVIITFFSLLSIFYSQKISEKIKSSIEVNVYLDDSVTANQIESVHNKLLSNTSFNSVKYLNKEQAAQQFIKETGEDFRDVLEYNPFPHTFVLTFKAEELNKKPISNYVSEIKKIDGVSEVFYDYSTALKILNILNKYLPILIIISILLISSSIYLVYANYKMQIINSSNIYKTMKYVGTKESAMKIPIVLNGFMVGFIASILVAIIFNLIYIILTGMVINLKLAQQNYLFNLFIFVIGITLGLTGSILSSRTISRVLSKIS